MIGSKKIRKYSLKKPLFGLSTLPLALAARLWLGIAWHNYAGFSWPRLGVWAWHCSVDPYLASTQVQPVDIDRSQSTQRAIQSPFSSQIGTLDQQLASNQAQPVDID